MKHLSSKDWHDVADLCEQALSLVEETNGPNGLNSPLAHAKATELMRSLSMKATKNGNNAEQKELKQ